MTTAAADSIAVRSDSITRSIAVSTVSQLATRGIDVLVNVVVSLAIIRHLGPRGYGDYVVVITVVGLTGLLAEMGLPKLSVRELARDPSLAGRIVGSTTTVRLALALVAALVAQLALAAVGATSEVRLAALCAGLMVVAEALLGVVAVFHAALRQEYEAVARLAGNLVKLGAVLALVAADRGLVAIVTATSATLFIAALLAWVIARRRFGLRPSWDGPLVVRLLREALVVGPAVVAGVVYLKVDAVMVAVLATPADVGIYGAAYQPIEHLFLGSAVVVQVLYAALSRHRPGERGFVRTYVRGTEVLVAIFLPIAVVVAVSAEPLTQLAYDRRFAAASLPMAVLAAALVLLSVNVWQGMTLLAAHHPSANLRCLAVALVVNVALDLALIPWLGPVGAAYGTLLSAAVLVALSTTSVSRLTGATLDTAAMLRIGGGGLLLAGTAIATRSMGLQWLLAAGVGSACFFITLAATRVFGHADLRAALHRSGGAGNVEVATVRSAS